MIFQLIIRTIILYIVVVITMRLLGKRQIGQLQPFEFAVALMISELAAIPLTEDDKKLHHAIIPIVVLLSCQLLISFLSIKGVKVREYICGKPTVLIRDGRMLEKNMRHELYTINDLLEQLRFYSVQSVAEVETAILETNGQLSIVLKSQKRGVTPADLKVETPYETFAHDLIIDGKLISRSLEAVQLTREWLDTRLMESGVTDHSQVFYASVDPKGNLHVQKKGEALK